MAGRQPRGVSTAPVPWRSALSKEVLRRDAAAPEPSARDQASSPSIARPNKPGAPDSFARELREALGNPAKASSGTSPPYCDLFATLSAIRSTARTRRVASASR